MGDGRIEPAPTPRSSDEEGFEYELGDFVLLAEEDPPPPPQIRRSYVEQHAGDSTAVRHAGQFRPLSPPTTLCAAAKRRRANEIVAHARHNACDRNFHSSRAASPPSLVEAVTRLLS